MEGYRLYGVPLRLSAASLHATSLTKGRRIDLYAHLHDIPSGEPLRAHLVSMAELYTPHADSVCILEPKANSLKWWDSSGLRLTGPSEVDGVVRDIGDAPQRQPAQLNCRSTNN